jgi:transposase
LGQKRLKDMAAKRKKMHQVKSIIEILDRGYSQRQISRDLGVHRNTVKKYVDHLKSLNISYKEVLKYELKDFEKVFVSVYKPPKEKETERYKTLDKEMPELVSELRRKGVTGQLLFEEYEQRNGEDSYGRSQFFKYLSDTKRLQKATLKIHHIVGEKMLVDFSGDKLSYIDRDSGEVIECDVLICSLPYSGLIYAIPVRSQKQEDLILGVCCALQYIGGVPLSIVFDNLKSAVKKSSRYEPEFTEAIELLGLHYNTTCMATRPYKPKDKAHVERSVNITYQRIFAPLRDKQFFSLEELKEEVLQLVNELNNRKLSQGHRCRKELFDEEEKQVLKALPNNPYRIQHVTFGKVQCNYHVIIGQDGHQYSVQYHLIAKRLKIIYTTELVEIYDDLARVAVHKRSFQRRGYTTLKEHMPPNHQAILDTNGLDAEYRYRYKNTRCGRSYSERKNIYTAEL